MGYSRRFVLAVSLCLAAQVQAGDDRFDAARRQMLAEIQERAGDEAKAERYLTKPVRRDARLGKRFLHLLWR
jgi:hypothetical protein